MSSYWSIRGSHGVSDKLLTKSASPTGQNVWYLSTYRPEQKGFFSPLNIQLAGYDTVFVLSNYP